MSFPSPPPPLDPDLGRGVRTLTVLQHVLFAALLLVCGVRAAVSPDTRGSPTGLFVALGMLAVAYAAGWWVVGGHGLAERREHPPRGAGGHGVLPRGRAATTWLLLLTACWLVLVAMSPENAWLAFSLWLLAGHILPRWWALVYVVCTLAVTIGAPWRTGMQDVARVIGPSIGATFALAVSRGQLQLARFAEDRARLVARLVDAQSEAETLHTELLSTQREAGALAERTRLSRDIHDTLAQGFSSIVLLTRAVTSRDTGVADRERLLEQIEATAAANLEESRRVVAALAPRDLQDAGLPAALARLLEGLRTETGLCAELRVDGDLTGLPTGTEVALLRTAQGALANVRRHAAASRVVVSLAEIDDRVRLDVVDDGVGFALADLGSPTSAGGYGLPAMRARLRELGGGLDVETAPGEGVALSAHLPLRGRT